MLKMSSEVKSDCGCQWTLDTPEGFLGKFIMIWRVVSCNQGPCKAGVAFTYPQAHKNVIKFAKDLNCHMLLPGGYKGQMYNR
jgi:hypothetical protein